MSPVNRMKAVQQLQSGKSLGLVCQELAKEGVHISREGLRKMMSKYLATGTVERCAGSGRPPCTTKRLDRSIVAVIRRYPKKTRANVREELGVPQIFNL